MERIHKINKLLLITYNLGGVCLLAISGLVGIGAPPGYIPMWLKISTGIIFSTMIIAHIVRYGLKRLNTK
ncbi:hypothetical protein [Enterococcus sp. AZ196]|uniref:hypothetical protein n=1 Tax=Enterococcus sp. AZ196 TaxID=2774659 RepID=UPI003D299C4E